MPRGVASKVFTLNLDASTDDTLRTLFASVHVEVVSFSSLPHLLQHLRPESRGCLLVNPQQQAGCVADLIGVLARRGIHVPVICLSEAGDVSGAVRALKGGATDFLEQPFNDQVLIDAVNQAFQADNGNWHAQRHRVRLRERFDRLTPREWDVVGPMVRGWSNREIASELHLSPKTVEVHRARILAKTGCRSLTDLIRTAIRCDLPAVGRPGTASASPDRR